MKLPYMPHIRRPTDFAEISPTKYFLAPVRPLVNFLDLQALNLVPDSSLTSQSPSPPIMSVSNVQHKQVSNDELNVDFIQ